MGAKGIGSVEKRGKNSYRLIVSCGVDSYGKQIKKTKTVSVPTPNQNKIPPKVYKLLADFASQLQHGTYVEPAKMTFNDFTRQWLRDYAEINLEPKTVHEYKGLLNGRIATAIGYLKIDNIKPTHLLDFYNSLRKPGERRSIVKDEDKKNKPLSENTILHYHRLISSILETAVEWKILKDNVAKDIKSPKIPKVKPQAYNEKQTADMLEALSHEPIKYIAMVVMAICTGGRREETMGLEWKTIDLNQGRLLFDKASQYIPGVGVKTKDTLKNESSIRESALPQQVIEMLKAYKIWQDKEKIKYESGGRNKVKRTWQDHDRLFTKRNGEPIHPDTISKWFPKFLKRHNLPHMPFKNLRHTHATLLLANGTPIYYVSKMLGHAQQSTADKFYGRPLVSIENQAIQKLDKTITIPNIKEEE